MTGVAALCAGHLERGGRDRTLGEVTDQRSRRMVHRAESASEFAGVGPRRGRALGSDKHGRRAVAKGNHRLVGCGISSDVRDVEIDTLFDERTTEGRARSTPALAIPSGGQPSGVHDDFRSTSMRRAA
jgi:hypothetical protein